MAHMNYGCMHPNPKTTEYPVAANQYFPHVGPSLVDVNGTGFLTLAETADSAIFGVAIVPTGRGNPTNTSDLYWMSGPEGQDRIPVIKVDSGYSFLLLADDTPAVSQAGDNCDLTATNSASVDYVNIGTSSTAVFIIQGRGVDFDNRAGANDVVVKLNPAKRQSA